MSAIHTILNDCEIEGDPLGLIRNEARAELAALQASEQYWQKQAETERSNAAEQRERAEQLRATVEAQDRKLEQARELFNLISDAASRAQDWSGTRLGDALDKCDAWLANAPTPQAEQEQAE